MLKPELFRGLAPAEVETILSIAISSLHEKGIAIARTAILPGRVLQRRHVVERIYFTLDRIARAGIPACAPSVVRHLAKLGVESRSLCAFDYLARTGLTPAELERRARAVETVKLGHNAYLSLLDHGASPVLNAFWPGLLEHLSGPGGVMIAFCCATDCAPDRLSRDVIGVGEPAEASKASLRRRFFDLHQELGRAPLSLGRNGVHGSPGIIEGACAVDTVFPAAEALPTFLEKVRQGPVMADVIRANPVLRKGTSAGRTLFEATEGLSLAGVMRVLRTGMDTPPQEAFAAE
jgi:hypothetical protein